MWGRGAGYEYPMRLPCMKHIKGGNESADYTLFPLLPAALNSMYACSFTERGTGRERESCGERQSKKNERMKRICFLFTANTECSFQVY